MKSFKYYITEAKAWTLNMLKVGDVVEMGKGGKSEGAATITKIEYVTREKDMIIVDFKYDNLKYGKGTFRKEQIMPGKLYGKQKIIKVVRKGKTLRP